MASLYSPKYITLEMVKQDLDGKVTFSNTNSKYLSDNEILNNIGRGEGWIERILSRQYIIDPALMGSDGRPFIEISNSSTINDIQQLCLVKTCIFILIISFGRSEGVRGDTYLENYRELLDELERDVLGKDEKSNQYLFPPFPGLMQDPQSSFYQKGAPFPMVSVIGVRSISQNGRLNERAIEGQINPFRNWFFNNAGRRGRC